MPSLLRRLRIVVVAGLCAVIIAAAGVLTTARPLVWLRPVAAVHPAAVDLARDPWYHLHLLATRRTFLPDPSVRTAPAMNVRGGILIDVDRGTILWEQDAHRRLPPASTAKIMTALVALENLRPDAEVTVTAEALGQQWDESRMGLGANQVLTVEELLSGMLLVSGNDAATSLAVDTVGGERFVAAMNAQAAALDLHDTSFANPVGLDDAHEFSSAYDLAVLAAVTEETQPLFAHLVAQHSLTLPATTGHPSFDLTSVNLLLSMYPAAVGIKPGWTGDAGYCLVGMAVRDGHRLLSVVLNAPYSYSQSRRLLDWGFVQEGLPSTLPSPTAAPSARASPPVHG